MPDPTSTEATTEDRAALRATRQALLALHKILLDRERMQYEREHGRIETTHQHLQLVMEHRSFAWLRPMSGLIVEYDERLSAKSALSAIEARQLAAEARALTTLSDESTEYQQRYRRAIEDTPEALAAHAGVARALAPFVGARR